MKNLVSFLIAFSWFTSFAKGQIVAITYRDPFPVVGGCTWCNTPFAVCNTDLRDFYIAFDNQGTPSEFTCRPNPYRITLSFYKNNNNLITSFQFTGSGTFLNFPASSLANIPVTPGTYYAVATFEVKPCGRNWKLKGTYTSNIITVTPLAATPNFTINGVAATDGTNNNVPSIICNAGLITIDASNTTCESAYWVGVWETTSNYWQRTYDYEWGGWFQGTAPNNINLQYLSTTSHLRWINGPNSRIDNILMGGLIGAALDPSFIGQDRYYTIEVCTGTPTWTCKRIHIKVVW